MHIKSNKQYLHEIYFNQIFRMAISTKKNTEYPIKNGIIHAINPKERKTAMINNWNPNPYIETKVMNQFGKLRHLEAE